MRGRKKRPTVSNKADTEEINDSLRTEGEVKPQGVLLEIKYIIGRNTQNNLSQINYNYVIKLHNNSATPHV